MTESIEWDGQHLTIAVDARQPLRACGGDLTMAYDGVTDDNGHAIAHVHLREHVAAFAALQVIRVLHEPNPEGFVPWCPTCNTPAPCETYRAATAVREIRP